MEKTISLQKQVFAAGVLALLGWTANSPVAADPSFTIHIGSQGPPPPREDYQRWEPPYRTAVWIPGHNEWRDGEYVWVGGYYAYPPRRRSHWVEPRYLHEQDGYYYRPGHWSGEEDREGRHNDHHDDHHGENN